MSLYHKLSRIFLWTIKCHICFFLDDWTRHRNMTRAESTYCYTCILKLRSREIELVWSVEWSANFFCKKPESKYFAFASHFLSLIYTQLCRGSLHAAIDTWMGKPCLHKQVLGIIWPITFSLLSTDLHHGTCLDWKNGQPFGATYILY